jgi:hypothetical protein
MQPTIQAEQATRRAQVVDAPADSVATLDRPPIHVAVDGLDDPAQRPGLTPLLRLGCGWAVAVGLSLQRSAGEAGSSDHRRSLCPST